MAVRLNWSPRVIGDEQRVYRSVSPFDASSLPTALATVAASAQSYLDASTSAGEVYYYAVGAVSGASVSLSPLAYVQTSSDGWLLSGGTWSDGGIWSDIAVWED